MKTLRQVESILSANREELAKLYKVKEMGIFSSYARGDQKKGSDVDILVKFFHGASLFDMVGAGDFLEKKLRMKVDIVSEGGLRKELRKGIIRELVKAA
jgi:hypothetical protein